MTGGKEKEAFLNIWAEVGQDVINVPAEVC